MHRHKGLEWPAIQLELEDNQGKLWSLNQMEKTGGEPNVAGYDRKTGKHIFYNCLAESTRGRRSVCYDHEVLDSRQENKLENSAVEMASDMGIGLLSENG